MARETLEERRIGPLPKAAHFNAMGAFLSFVLTDWMPHDYLAMVFGEGSATARGRSSSSVAAELRRPALRPLLLPPLVPSYGGGAGGRLRGGETTGLARSGGLDLGPWRRQPELAASMSS